MKRFFFVCSIILLTACSSHSWNTQPVTVSQTPDSQNAQVKIAEAAASVSDSLAQLAAIEKATHADVKLPPPANPASIDMAQHVSVDWNGPLEPLLQQIAKASNYRLQVLGKRPVVPVIVTVNASDEPLASVLRDASYQAAKQANVLVYFSRRIIELRYRNV